MPALLELAMMIFSSFVGVLGLYVFVGKGLRVILRTP